MNVCMCLTLSTISVSNITVLAIRKQPRSMLNHKKCRIHGKLQRFACATSTPTSQNGFCRRDLVLFGLSSSLSIMLPSLGTLNWNCVKGISKVILVHKKPC
jgi:hypothetical protein